MTKPTGPGEKATAEVVPLRPTRPCPICKKPELSHLNYVFGDELGQYSGRIKSRTEIEQMAHEHGEIRIYVLEVCRNCAWNHLVESYVVGDGVPRKAPRRQRTVEDDD